LKNPREHQEPILCLPRSPRLPPLTHSRKCLMYLLWGGSRGQGCVKAGTILRGTQKQFDQWVHQFSCGGRRWVYTRQPSGPLILLPYWPPNPTEHLGRSPGAE
jgi:hypothetical protein